MKNIRSINNSEVVVEALAVSKRPSFATQNNSETVYFPPGYQEKLFSRVATQ